jgi:steroid delta-isomerase-like uncharacterized protein
MKGPVIILCVTSLSWTGCSSSSTNTARQVEQENLSLGRRVFGEIYGGGKVDLVDQLYSEDFVDDSPGGGKGRELIKDAVTAFHKAIPDLRIDIEDAFAVNDKVVLRYTARGTQTGPYSDSPASGKPVTARGITIFQVVNGRIKMEWTEYDRLGVLRQIGAVPSD